MSDHDGLVRVQGCVFVLVDLRVEGTDLHVSLALVFEHLEFEGGVCWVIEVVLHILAGQVSQALLQASGTLVEHAQLLVAKAHVVHRE